MKLQIGDNNLKMKHLLKVSDSTGFEGPMMVNLRS